MLTAWQRCHIRFVEVGVDQLAFVALGHPLPVLLETLPVPLRDAPLRGIAPSCQDKSVPATPGQKRKRINTLKELLEAYPDFEELLIDATEQEISQPQDKLNRKQAYSGKPHDHTLKTRIVATRTLLLHVFGGLPGSLHDMTVLRASGVVHQIPKRVKVRLDKGYAGAVEREPFNADTAYPDVAVELPIKKKRHHTITVLGKAYNHLLSVLRMPVEHHFARLQKFGCLAGLWRAPQNGHEDVFCIVGGLLNYRATGRFDLA